MIDAVVRAQPLTAVPLAPVSMGAGASAEGVNFKSLIERLRLEATASRIQRPALLEGMSGLVDKLNADQLQVGELLGSKSLTLDQSMVLMQRVHESSLRMMLMSHMATTVTQSISQLTTKMS